MKYDKDLIDTVYLLGQTNPELAERMWDRLVNPVVESVSTATSFNSFEDSKVYVGDNNYIPRSVMLYMKNNHGNINKVAAIKALREKTGWGLREAKYAVDFMLDNGIMN